MPPGTEIVLDSRNGNAPRIINLADVETDSVMDALRGADGNERVMALLGDWASQTQAPSPYNRAGGLFERDRYVTPAKTFDQIRMAQDAADSDDVVSGVLESTESMAFSSMTFTAEDEDEQDIWNQVAADLDLDSRLREMWRELFIASQFYVAVWWGRKTYKVRGETTKGNARKRQFNVTVPVGLTILDPLKIVPVGNTMFNREGLAYIADRGEAAAFDQVISGELEDPVVANLVIGRYTPNMAEKRRLQACGVTTVGDLFLLNPAMVFRHTATRPQYRHFAAVRMRSVFELLDLKNQMRQMDRAHLIGGTNFIVLITKGTDQLPANQTEVDNLKAQVRVIARVPVIVGDHRLKVEIVTPKLDQTLRPERYNTIDSRITARLYQMFLLGNYAAGSGNDDSLKLARMVGMGMESRRHMIRRTLESRLWRVAVERNPETFTAMPKMQFHPKKIALDFDAAFASFLMDLRAQGDLSRDSILSQFDFDQDEEYRNRKREKAKYDDTFETLIPGAPAPVNQDAGNQDAGNQDGTQQVTTPGKSRVAKKQAGRRQGGRRNGGGAAPGSGQGKPARNVRKTSDGGRAAAADDHVDDEHDGDDELED